MSAGMYWTYILADILVGWTAGEALHQRVTGQWWGNQHNDPYAVVAWIATTWLMIAVTNWVYKRSNRR